MTMSDTRTAIRALLARLGTGAPFTDTDDVFDRGIVKSINLIELIGFLEDSYGLLIDQRDVFEGHLRSVDRLVALVEARDGGAA